MTDQTHFFGDDCDPPHTLPECGNIFHFHNVAGFCSTCAKPWKQWDTPQAPPTDAPTKSYPTNDALALAIFGAWMRARIILSDEPLDDCWGEAAGIAADVARETLLAGEAEPP